MHELLLNLSRTGRVATVVVNINIADRTITFRAKKRRNNRLFKSAPPLFNRTEKIRDHLPTPLHSHEILVLDLFFSNKIKIMKTDPRNRRSTELHRLNIGNRRDDSCPSDLKSKRKNLACDLLCWEFVGDRSSWVMFGRTEDFADSKSAFFLLFSSKKRKS